MLISVNQYKASRKEKILESLLSSGREQLKESVLFDV